MFDTYGFQREKTNGEFIGGMFDHVTRLVLKNNNDNIFFGAPDNAENDGRQIPPNIVFGR